jgi:hypothetical protein
MKLIDNNILFLEFAEMVACDVPRDTVVKWDNIKDPTDKRKTLIRYEALKDKYKQIIIKKYGDPYTYVHNQVIKQFLRVDTKAFDFYSTYKPNGIALSTDYQKQYITCANWLNLLIEVDNNWGKCKKTLCMDAKPELYDAVIKIFEAETIKLPKSYQPLKRKIADYKAGGYAALVSGKFGNSNPKKVKDELNSALLLEWLCKSTQHDDVFVALKYNTAAKVAGFKPITATTVGHYRRLNAAKIDNFRKGNAAWYDTAGKTIHRSRPSAPLMLINTDDNELDLYFQEVRFNKAGHSVVNYYHRKVVYVVLDAYNDYILGYAIGDTQTTELVQAAFLDAANHVKQLTGDHYFWRQIVADHWNLKALAPYFDQQAHFTPAAAKNARAKVIEQSFGKKWHGKLKELFPLNYSGHNITAKAKLNRDAIEANKKFFPAKEQAPDDIAQFIAEMRQLVDPATGKTKEQQWKEAFECTQAQEKRLITAEQHLMWLGQEHKHSLNGNILHNTITNNGLMPTINGEERIYEIPADLYRDTLGLRVKIKYDPYDLSYVLAMTDDERTRIVCREFERVPMALADYKEGSRTRINALLTEKKGHVLSNVAEKEEREAILKRAGIDSRSLLQAGVLTKQIKQEAERQLTAGGSEDQDKINIYDLM